MKRPQAKKKQIRDLNTILNTDVPTVSEDTPMNEIFDIIHDSPVPVAVVTDGKLMGIIIRGAVIAALSNDGEVNINHG